MIRGVGILVGSALVVLMAVLGLGRTILPDSPSAPMAADAATSTTVSAGGEFSLRPDQSPTAAGGEIRISGDRDATIAFGRPEPAAFAINRFPTTEDSRFALEMDGNALRFGRVDGRPEIEQANLLGLNLFLDPGDCEFAEVGSNDDVGLATVEIACMNVSDIQETNRISIEGFLYLPLYVAAPDDRYESGGTVELTGDLEAVMEFVPAVWNVDLVEDQETHEIDDVVDRFQVNNFADNGEFLGEVWFFVDEGAVSVGRVELLFDTTVVFDSGECPVQVTEPTRIGPETEFLEVAFSCQQAEGMVLDPSGGESESAVLDLRGDLRVHRVTGVVQDFG